MKNRISEFMAGILFVSVLSASAGPESPAAAEAKAVESPRWIPVDEGAWAILLEEPQAHLQSAQEDLSNRDPNGAAAEIRRADTFLKIQENKLAVASAQLLGLAKDIESGKAVSSEEVKGTFNNAVNVLDHRQAVVTAMAGVDIMYMDETDYHLARAADSLEKKNNKAAAADIRKAEAYLKLKSVHASDNTKADLLSSAAALEGLAVKIAAGADAGAKDIDLAFARARKEVQTTL